jgi:polysaccharide pyruvyl transferase CsaB
MRVLVSAFIGSTNLGDEAISQMVLNKLAYDEELEVCALTSDAPKTRKLIDNKSIKLYKASLGSFVAELRKSDCLILGGGGIIQDESSVLNLLYYYLQVIVAKHLLRKPVYMFFVGVGPIKTRLGSRMIRGMGRRVSHSVVRDIESAALLKKFGFHDDRITVSYDIVFNFPRVGKPVNGDYVVFCPRDWFFTRKMLPAKYSLKIAKKNSSSDLFEFRRSLLKLVEGMLSLERDLKMIGVPLYYAQDLDTLNWIDSNIDHRLADRFVVMDKEYTPNGFLKELRGARGLIGMRLHSLILGVVAGVPIAPIVYSEKVRSLVKYLGLSNHTTFLTKPRFDTSAAIAKVRDTISISSSLYADQTSTIKRTNEATIITFIDRIKEDYRNIDK